MSEPWWETMNREHPSSYCSCGEPKDYPHTAVPACAVEVPPLSPSPAPGRWRGQLLAVGRMVLLFVLAVGCTPVFAVWDAVLGTRALWSNAWPDIKGEWYEFRKLRG